MRRVKIKKCSNDDVGVVGIVTAILLVGLLVTVLSVVQVVYVPQWMEELEKDHMDIISAQFSELKHTIDIQMYQPSMYTIPITTPITLGSENIPYFLSRESAGSFQIKSDAIECEIEGNSTDTHILNTIEYSSVNSYYNDQTYSYEAGAVILSQSEGSLLLSKPFISVTDDASINISITLVNMSLSEGKTSVYGSHSCSILTNYSNSENSTIKNVKDITLSTSYIKPWKDFMNSTFSNKGLTEGVDYVINESSDDFTIDFHSASKPVHCFITKITMNAQIAPGWIS